ncbi:MAG: DUF2141 domain-containing protein [Candidatus Scalindua sp.]|nr:DUF2141 domain-containing protein [Candidatus Scalindua sp.]
MMKIPIKITFIVIIVVSNVILNFVLSSVKAEEVGTINGKGRIEVEVIGLESSKGKVYFCLHTSETFTKENLVKEYQAKDYLHEALKIDDMKCKWISEPVNYGYYAVIVLHDENNNGSIDKYWYKKPKEKIGISNYEEKIINYLDSEHFDKAKIKLDSEKITIKIKLFIPGPSSITECLKAFKSIIL